MSMLLDRLHKYENNRGMMANLRCVLVDSKKHRAWPALYRLGIPIDNDVSAFIAGLFATHPEVSSTGNFGTTCKAIEIRRNETAGSDLKVTQTERRFQHLLAANNEEVFDRVKRLILMAKSQGIPVNYEQLETDLRFWGDRTKTDWAVSFWAPSAPTAMEEDL
ncbi:MAG: type I-E CRISPR-associated protein Cse2/CasB [Smithella sp.]|nr:type I-E CRISPR-associated protein Cse2/CasB [Smithella sp.]